LIAGSKWANSSSSWAWDWEPSCSMNSIAMSLPLVASLSQLLLIAHQCVYLSWVGSDDSVPQYWLDWWMLHGRRRSGTNVVSAWSTRTTRGSWPLETGRRLSEFPCSRANDPKCRKERYTANNLNAKSRGICTLMTLVWSRAGVRWVVSPAWQCRGGDLSREFPSFEMYY
jgi:hypothetical protein